MARLICWMLADIPAHRLRRFLIGLLAGEFVLAAVLFALAGSANAGFYLIAVALVVTFIGIWRERLLN